MFYEDSRMGMAKSATPNPYNNHGVGCTCVSMRADTRTGDGKAGCRC